MTIDEFHLMPRRLGWKYEYFDGMAHVTPSSVFVECALDVGSRPAPTDHDVRPVDPCQIHAVREGFREAFQDSVEYSDWPQAAFEKSVLDSIKGYFEGTHGTPSPASRAAFAGNELIGAALVAIREDRHWLQPLFVRSLWRRQSVATALVSAVIESLHGLHATRLYSSFLLANKASRLWHRRFGFTEIPSELFLRHCLQHCRHELWRRQECGELSEADRSRLNAEQECLEAKLRALEYHAA